MKSCVLRVPDSYGSQACVACLYSTEWISYTTRLYSTARPARASCFVLRGNLVLSFEYLRHHTRLRTRLFCPSWIHAITQYSEQRWSVLHCFTTSSDHQNNNYAPLLDDITRSSEQRCVIFRGFMISHYCLNNVVLFFATSRHGTIIISIFCALWLQYISSSLEQRWFVLYCLTTSHNRQNNVGLSFIVSRLHTIVRTSVCPSLSHDITQPSEQRRFVLHGFTTNSVSTTWTATSLLSFPASAYSLVQAKLLRMWISLSSETGGWLVLPPRHCTTVRATSSRATWLHKTKRQREQRCFVLHVFTTPHDRQDNVVLSFIASWHHVIVRITLFCLS